jgi:transposase
MGRKENVPNRQYTLEFKVEAVRLAESIGGNQAAKRLGIPDSSIWNWIRLSRTGKLKAADPSAVPTRRAPPNSKPRMLACDGNWQTRSRMSKY